MSTPTGSAARRRSVATLDQMLAAAQPASSAKWHSSSRLLANDLLVTASAFIATNPEALIPYHIASTPPLGPNLLTLNNLRRGAGFGGPQLEILDCEHVLDRLLPMVERKIKEAPVDGHEPWPPKARTLRTAPSGPMCTSAQRGSEAPISSMLRSNGPKLSPISRNPDHSPESAP